MKEETLKRLLSLIEKTGDRLVITDPAGENPFVLMGLDHYEKLVVGEWKPEVMKRDPAPPQTLPISTSFPDNKPPKREIPLWKAPPQPPPPGPRLAQDRPRIDERPAPEALKPPEPRPKLAPEPRPNPLQPPPTPQNAAQDQEGEEQFYLEPLE
ncbi:MAG: hypothetical protein QY323_03330 [Patescibacteria group bacterium]|nr:MAG: hypothetical protein QY323_03330 [Patescibacteria group bacterium]